MFEGMYRDVYVPVDNSDHSNAAVEVAVRLAQATGAKLTGCHVYAARMHDVRFKQMEYTLPEEYQDEQELERQRKIHDSLITRGLQLISDSYLDVLGEACEKAGVWVDYKTFDGKNWECLVKDARDSAYDLVVIGSLGMGAVKDSQLGSVTERFVRRVRTDTLVVRDPHPFAEGASDRIVVAVDGSPQSFAALKTGIELAGIFGKRVEAVAAFDPYLHYSMFNGIVDVLSDEASKVFRFKEQEQLHEEIIDSGLAKIYESHLKVAAGIAKAEGVELETTLLDGKAFKKILQHLRADPPWLLLLGRIGVHSGEEMDIGSNAENLLRLAPCSVLLSSRTHVPPVDLQAEAGLVWTPEALQRLEAVPAHVQGVVRTAIARHALERGHSVVSTSVVDQAVGELMPSQAAKLGAAPAAPRAAETWVCRHCGRAVRGERPVACGVCGGDDFGEVDRAAASRQAEAEGGTVTEAAFDGVHVHWTLEGKKVLERVPKGYERRRVKAIIEKRARVRALPAITAEFAEANLDDAYAPVADAVSMDAAPLWSEAGAGRLEQVPAGFQRTLARTRSEDFARRIGAAEITAEVVEGALADAPDLFRAAGGCPVHHGAVPSAPAVEHPSPGWTEDGVRRLNEVEVAASRKFDPTRAREMAKHAAESRAARTSEALNAAFLERLGLKLGYGHPLSEKTFQHSFTWTPEAEERLRRVPEFCRELTRWRVEWTAYKNGLGTVITPEAMDVKFDAWGEISHQIEESGRSLPWSEEAERRLARVPDFVRGQVVQAVEGNARALGSAEVTGAVLDSVIERWVETGDFHEGRYGFKA